MGSVQTLGQCPRALITILFLSPTSFRCNQTTPPILSRPDYSNRTMGQQWRFSCTTLQHEIYPNPMAQLVQSKLHPPKRHLLCACFACNPRLQLFGFAAWVSEITLLFFPPVLEHVAGRPLCIHIHLPWARYCTPIFNWDMPG